MKKIYLFMLMAVGLLISGSMWAQVPKQPVLSVEPKGFQMNPDVNGSVQKAPINKAAQNEESQVRLTYGSFDQTFKGDRALQDAFDALPANSTPAFVTLLTDVNVPTAQSTVTMAQYHNVTLDLNGHNIYGSTSVTGTSAVITNNGTLIIEDKVGGGSISNLETNPEDYEKEGKPYPSYAYNVISNNGTLTINGGYFVNDTKSNSSYVVDNNSSARSAKFIMNGGTLENPATNAIRQFCNSTKNTNDVIINEGLVYGYSPIWMQSPNTNKNVGSLTINGGEIRSHANCYVKGTCTLKETPDYIYNWGSNASQDYSAMSITITGGTFNVNLNTYGNIKTRVSGGVFNANFRATTTDTQLSGGIYTGFDTAESNDYYYWCYFSQEYSKAQIEEYMQSLDLNVKDYHEYNSSYPEGQYWAIYKGDTYWFAEYQSSYTKEELESYINNLIIVDYHEYDKGIGANQYWAAVSVSGVHSEYLDFKNDKKGWIVEGYVAVPCKEEGFTPETDLMITTVDKKDVEVGEGNKNLGELVPDIKPDGTTEITIVPNTTEGQTTIINITENTNVNKIKVTNEDEEGNKKGEAQIVVGTGVVLNVGNGGIVSENDILTTVLVKDGGTLIIGKNGVERDGEATPIEIKSSEENGSGVLIFNPNAKHEDTKNYAEVDLYTYCKKVNDKYYWQQFAIPVTGLDNSKVVKNPNKTSYVFEWDYATYGWSQLNNWEQLDEPFAGYDITNVSENGGVVYTFKGDLIGNQNIQLTLPHKDYCVMGNSYTAPIDITALFDQINKEMSENTIEKTVYKYDAKAGYYVYTNELEQTLSKLGITNASFTDIKPMEGFLLNLQNGNTAGVMLNYANAVFNPAMNKAAGGSNAPRMSNNTDMVVAKISIQGAHAMDQMTLVESNEFSADIENGKDAFKYLNEGANLYAFDGTNKLAMVATDNLEGTMLAFQAAEDEEYTLTFDRALNADYSLLDLLTGESIEMVEGNTYTFYATPNTLNPSRFMVVATAKAPTAVENAKVNEGAKGIYTIMGQYIGSAEMWNEMPQGVYVVNGIKMVK